MSDLTRVERIWLRGGRLFVRNGWLDSEDGERTHIACGEVQIRDGWLVLNGPWPEEAEQPREAEDRRNNGQERRQRERRGGDRRRQK